MLRARFVPVSSYIACYHGQCYSGSWSPASASLITRISITSEICWPWLWYSVHCWDPQLSLCCECITFYFKMLLWLFFRDFACFLCLLGPLTFWLFDDDKVRLLHWAIHVVRRNLREHGRQRNDWLRSMKILCSTCHFLASFGIFGLGMIGGPISRCGDWGRGPHSWHSCNRHWITCWCRNCWILCWKPPGTLFFVAIWEGNTMCYVQTEFLVVGLLENSRWM